MKNYYFDKYFNTLEENVTDDCEEIFYIVVNDIEKFRAFCDRISMVDDGVTSIGIYYFYHGYGEWRELNQYAHSTDYDKLVKYLNKTEDNLKENNIMDSKEKTFNYSIEFKNGGFISKENCNKSFDEIFNSVKDLYNSVVFGDNVKKITIEMN